MAGTTSAIFAALVLNLLAHVHRLYLWFGRPIDWTYTADISLRFIYVIWFLVYFFISSLRSESRHNLVPPDEELKFDVVQSVTALATLFSLDFFGSRGFVIGSSYRWAIFSANAAIAIICVSALVLLKNRHDAQMTRQRCYGLAIALLSIGAIELPNSAGSWTVWFALAVGLFYPLANFIRHRFRAAEWLKYYPAHDIPPSESP